METFSTPDPVFEEVGEGGIRRIPSKSDRDGTFAPFSFPSRPLLIFNHNPKAGGGSILKVLREFKSLEIHCKRRPDKRATSGCEKDVWQKLSQSSSRDHYHQSFLHVGEFSRTTLADRQRGFVIASIREPCAQYVSLWAFGSMNHGRFRHETVPQAELYGLSSPYFNSTEDVGRFRKWMLHKEVHGLIGRRIKASYGDAILDSVDCWVFVENFQNSLLGCLRKYEIQGGFVNWTSPTLASMLLDEDASFPPRKLKTKDDPLGDPRLDHHASCERFFDNSTSNAVHKTEGFVYDLFGYDGCCEPGNKILGSKTFQNDVKNVHNIRDDAILASFFRVNDGKRNHATNIIEGTCTRYSILRILLLFVLVAMFIHCKRNRLSAQTGFRVHSS